MPLRLVAWGGGLGIELYEPQALGPLRVEDLVWSLPGITFPVDLSGGVRAFRSRRGELSTLRVEADMGALEEWLQSRLGAVLGGLYERPAIWGVPGGLGLGLQGPDGVLACELLWAPEGATGRWVISRARSAGMAGVAVAAAMRVVSVALGRIAVRRGRVFDLPEAASQIVRQLLPAVGVRAPASSGARLGPWAAHDSTFSVVIDAQSPPELTEDTQRSLHLAALLERGDDALFEGRTEEARAAYLAALERAPRHPEICRLIATIDVEFGERLESALGLLVESLPATAFGVVGAALLAKTGDWDGARAALDRAAADEVYPPLTARLWVEAARLAPDRATQSELLDLALAASAACREAREQRFRLRVEYGDLHGARSDAEHLEAQASGAVARHEVVVRCGEALMAAGYLEQAGRFFERALRYQPQDEAGALGLALVLLETGRAERASPLLARAVQSTDPVVAGRARVALGRVLAEHLRDLPQAISQVRRVDAESGQLLEARSLEAHWRAALGDIAGAALTYSKVRELVELGHADDPTLAVATLRAAANFARRDLLDLKSAERHLATALRLAPGDERLGSEYRSVAREVQAAQIAGQLAATSVPPQEAGELGDRAHAAAAPEPAERSVEPASEASAPAVAFDGAHLTEFDVFRRRFDGLDDVQQELEAEELRARYLSAPGQDAAFERLRYAFLATGRHVELHALLCAAYEDSEGDERAELREQLCSTLAQLQQETTDEMQKQLYAAQLGELAGDG